MELIHTYQTSLEEINAESFDIFIASCGYQNRCNYLLNNLSNLPSRKIVFARNDNGKLFFRKQHIHLFEQHNFEIVRINDSQVNIIQQYIRQLIQNNQARKIKILVDYSCMPFQWYNQILETLLEADQYLNKVEVYFTYIPAQNDDDATKQKIKKHVYATNQQIKKTGKPLALILELGLSLQVTREIISYYKPQEIVYFIANGSFHKEKSAAILENHMDFLKGTNENNVLDYPVENLEETMHRISSQCLNLRLSHQVLIVSNGFKPFKLASLLLQQQYTDVSICHIQLHTEHKNTGEPMPHPVIGKSILLSDDIVDEMEDDDVIEEDHKTDIHKQYR